MAQQQCLYVQGNSDKLAEARFYLKYFEEERRKDEQAWKAELAAAKAGTATAKAELAATKACMLASQTDLTRAQDQLILAETELPKQENICE